MEYTIYPCRISQPSTMVNSGMVYGRFARLFKLGNVHEQKLMTPDKAQNLNVYVCVYTYNISI